MGAANEQQFDCDVCVIGTGVAGALVAFRLAKAGAKVLILEAGDSAPQARFREPLVQKYELSSSKGQTSPYTGLLAPQPNAADVAQPPAKQDGRDYYVEQGDTAAVPRSELLLSYYQRMLGGAMSHWQG